MAKQSGIHQLKGKVRGMSYYRQKGVVDGLARSINEGMSKRVKEDDAFYNTRLNAAEFGFAGSFAGASIRAITERQRTMLKNFATGIFAKYVRDIIVSDTTNKWGERDLNGSTWQEGALQALNSYAKLDFRSYVGGTWDCSVAVSGGTATWTPNTELPADWGALYKAQGVTGAIVELYAYRVALVPVGTGKKKGIANVTLVGDSDVTIGSSGTITAPATLPARYSGSQDDNLMQGMLVVVKPYQEVNSIKYIRQELCTFQIVEVEHS